MRTSTADEQVTLLTVMQGVLQIQQEIEAQHRHKLLSPCQCQICQLARKATDLLTEAYTHATMGEKI